MSREQTDKKEVLLQFIKFFTAGILLLAICFYLIYAYQIKMEISFIKEREAATLNLAMSHIPVYFHDVVNDLFFISHNTEMLSYMDKQNTRTRTVIEKEWEIISRDKRVYDQIRLLDKSGMEIIRVNYNNGRPSAVPGPELQDKSGRYYFKEFQGVGPHEFYVSPFDLNIEKGVVEEPRKPMLRFVTRVHIEQGDNLGFLVINYLGDEIIETIRHHYRENASKSMLLNKEGYWLIGPDPEIEWGFMYGKDNQRIGSVYPAEWERIARHESGQILTGNGLFTFKWVYPLEGLRPEARHTETHMPGQESGDGINYHWIAVSQVPTEKITLLLANHRRSLLIAFLTIAGLYIYVSWLWALGHVRRRQAEAENDQYRWGLEALVDERTKALSESEERYRRVVSDSPIGISIYDSSGQCIAANDSVASIIGATKEQVLAQNYHEIQSWKEHGLYEKAVAAVKEKKSSNLDVTAITTFGKKIHVNTYFVPLPSDGLLFMMNDLTEQVMAEERSRAIINGAYDSFMVVGEDGRVLEANKAASRMLGYGHDELISMHISQIDINDSPEDVAERIQLIMERGGLTFETTQRRKDGRVIDVEVSISTYMNAEGKPVSFGFSRDITERKRIAAELDSTRKRLEHVLMSTPAIIYACRAYGDFGSTFVTDNIKEIMGYSPEECTGNPGFWREGLHPDEAEDVLKGFDTLFEAGRLNHEYRFRRKDGAYVWVHDEIRLVYGEDGEPREMVGYWSDITERKQIEQELLRHKEHLEDLVDERSRALKESASSFRAIADYTYGWESWFGPEGEPLWINPAVESHTGYTVEECLSMPDYPMPLIHDEDRSGFKEILEHAVSSRSSQGDVSFRVRHKDGSVRHMSAGLQAVYGDEEEYRGIRSSARDVTEQVRTQEELNGSHSLISSVVQSTEDAVFVKDTGGHYLLMNTAALKFMGMEWKDLAGKRDSDIFPEDIAAALVAADKKVIESGETSIHEESVDIDGENTHWLSAKSPYKNQKGEVLGVVGVSHNITQRKTMEDELRISEERFRELFDHTPIAYQSLDESGRFIDVNDIWLEMLGYGRDEVMGRKFGEFWDEETRDSFQGTFDKFKNNCVIDNAELTLMKKDGEPMDVLITGRVQKDIYGKFLKTHCIIVDITERKDMEKELDVYVRMQAMLLKEISHRVKNNLYSILGMVNAEKERAGKESREVLQSIESRIQVLSSVHNLLSGSEWRPVRLDELCEEVFKGVFAGVPETLKVEHSVSSCGIKIESKTAHQLAMLFNELATNSVKHAVGGSDVLSVKVNMEQKDDGSIGITYRDNGPGYPDSIVHGDLSAESLGFDIMRSIATSNIHGKIIFRNDGGAVCELEFDPSALG